MGAYDAVEIKFTVVISLLDRPCSLSARRRTGKTLYFVINLPVILLLYKLNLFLFQLSTKTIHHIRSFVTTDKREAEFEECAKQLVFAQWVTYGSQP